jgi:hypothetical protein
MDQVVSSCVNGLSSLREAYFNLKGLEWKGEVHVCCCVFFFFLLFCFFFFLCTSSIVYVSHTGLFRTSVRSVQDQIPVWS